MTNFNRALSAAAALSRHIEGRSLLPADHADAVFIEGLALIIADRGRAEAARALRATADHLEAPRG
jgi:hypothetical protein